jgi:endonuclease/exonuclease/phosphatase family metal-dependent hydrolase
MHRKFFPILILLSGILLQSCAGVFNFLDADGPAYAGSYIAAPTLDDHLIKVVSYNIAWGKHIDQAIAELESFPELHDADILMLQEMDIHGVEKIAEHLECNFVYYPGSIHNLSHKDIGNAILSRWPMSDGKKMIFPHKQSWNNRIRTATVATVTIDGVRVRAYNVHTATVLMSDAKKLDQLEAVVDDVSPGYDCVLVAGDFNTVLPGSVSRSAALFEKAGFDYASADAGATFDVLGLLPLTLDHLFTKGLRVQASGVVKKARASDHFPLWAVFQQPQPPVQLSMVTPH